MFIPNEGLPKDCPYPFFTQYPGCSYHYDAKKGFVFEEYSKKFPPRPIYNPHNKLHHKFKMDDQKYIRMIFDLFGEATIIEQIADLQRIEGVKNKYEKILPEMNKYFNGLKKRSDVEALLFRRFIFEVGFMKTLQKIGIRNREIGNVKNAIAYYNRGIEICKTRKNVDILNDIEDSEFKILLYKFRKKAHPYVFFQSTLQCDKSIAYYITGNIRQSMSIAKEALKNVLEYKKKRLSRENEETEKQKEFCPMYVVNELIGRIYNVYFDIYRESNNGFLMFYYYTLAMHSYSSSIENAGVFEGNSHLFFQRIALYFKSRGHLESALDLLEKTFELNLEIGSKTMYDQSGREISANIVEILSEKLFDHEKLVLWVDRLIDISKVVGEKYYGNKTDSTYFYCYGNHLIALSLLKRGKNEEAKKIWINCINVVKTIPKEKKDSKEIRFFLEKMNKSIKTINKKQYKLDNRDPPKQNLFNLKHMKEEHLKELKKIFKVKTRSEVVEKIKYVFSGESSIVCLKNLVKKKKCWYCGCTFFKLKYCVQCEITSYCSRSCQAKHWKKHKEECL